jgi:hypothetical protein
MTTTHLFVELLVIGIGAFAALLLLLAAIFGWSPDTFSGLMGLQALFPILAAVYVLGILVDRLADICFDWKDKEQRREIFPDDDEKHTKYFESRRTLVIDGENLWRDLEYVRSRSRICRGWTVNSLLLAICFTIYHFSNTSALDLSLGNLLFLNFCWIGLATCCALCWARLNFNEYKKTKRIAEWLKKRTLETTKIEWFVDKASQEMETGIKRIYKEQIDEVVDESENSEG